MHSLLNLLLLVIFALVLLAAPAAAATKPPADPFVAAQAPALLPAQSGDLTRAGEWDRYTIVAALDPARPAIRGSVAVEVTNRSAAPYERLYFRLYPNHPDFGERALRAFNARFGAYPLAELEIVQGAMTQFLGMEYPGVVLIEQELYESNGRGLETTVAHELAHQWWYSQVGSDAQGEPWLDEGLASYSQVLYYEATGDTRQALAELDGFRNTYRQARSSRRDAPLGSPPQNLAGIYVPIVYAKGGLFFHALRGQIGEEAFGRFLQGYYAAGRYGEVSGPDLLRAAENACGCELDPLYRDWVLTAARVPIP